MAVRGGDKPVGDKTLVEELLSLVGLCSCDEDMMRISSKIGDLLEVNIEIFSFVACLCKSSHTHTLG